MCRFIVSICRNLGEALNEFTPDVIVYNAGTDVLEGDPLGNLDVTADVSSHSFTVKSLNFVGSRFHAFAVMDISVRCSIHTSDYKSVNSLNF